MLYENFKPHIHCAFKTFREVCKELNEIPHSLMLIITGFGKYFESVLLADISLFKRKVKRQFLADPQKLKMTNV